MVAAGDGVPVAESELRFRLIGTVARFLAEEWLDGVRILRRSPRARTLEAQGACRTHEERSHREIPNVGEGAGRGPGQRITVAGAADRIGAEIGLHRPPQGS